MGKPNIVMDASMLDMFELCEERYHNAYVLNIRLADGERAHQLDRGTLCHVGCEYYYNDIKNGVVYQDAVNHALSEIRTAGVIGTGLEMEEINLVIDVMEEYFDYWRVEDQRFEINDVESPFIYLLHEDEDMKLYMCGKIDLVTSDNRYQ